MSRAERCEPNFLHLAMDDKFIPFVQRVFETAFPGGNRFLVSPLDEKQRFMQPSDTVRRVERRYWFSSQLRRDLAWCQCLVVHYMTPWFARAVRQAPGEVAVVWGAWGGDFYDLLPQFAGTAQYLPRTREIVSRLGAGGRWRARALLDRMRDRAYLALLPRWERSIVGRIDAVSMLPAEHRLFAASHPRFRAERHKLFYGSMESTFMAGPERASGRDILVGNSATPANNHAEAFALLAGLDLAGRNVVVPLSYGDAEYADEICRIGTRLFGARFAPLRRFMPLAEYNARIAGCSTLLMNHVRQQGMGNINTAFFKGLRVYLRPDNPLFAFYRELGLPARALPEARFEEALLEPAGEAETLASRGILAEHFAFGRAVDAARGLARFVAQRQALHGARPGAA